jgi:hypothetical protein
MAFKRKQVIWVMAICFTLFISCMYMLFLPRNTFAGGIQVNGSQLGIEVNPTHALFSVTNMAPGWQGSANLEVSNAGQGPFSYSLSAILNSGDQLLLNVLVLKLQDKEGNVLYDDSMGNLQNLQLGTLNTGANSGYIFTVTFPDNAGNQYQGRTGSVNFVFTAAENESGGGHTANPPTAQTLGATDVAAGSAVLNGSITADGGADVTGYGFFWGADANNLNNTLEVGTDNHVGIFQANLDNLAVGASYYFQAYAKNGSGIARGEIEQFTAAAPPAPVPAPAFSDVAVSSYWASSAIVNLSNQGYIIGYPDGTFRPGNQITRAEFAAILDKALKLTPYTPQTPTFRDVSPADWFFQIVETAVHAGIVKGNGDGTFQPNAPISRQEVVCALVQALGKSRLADSDAQTGTSFVDDHDIAWWSRGYIYVALQQGIISGYPDNTLRPRADATRAEASVMIVDFLGAPR